MLTLALLLLGVPLAGADTVTSSYVAFRHAPEPWQLPRGAVAVTLGFTGDVMVHGQQIKAARQPDGTYAMPGLFDAVAPFTTSPDWMAGNLETNVAGEDLGGYTGYPRFNSPPSILDELRRAGFDLLQTTNNHCLDRGALGARRTLEAVDRYGFRRVGTYLSLDERRAPWTSVDVGGVRIAFLAYTYGTEAGGPRPDEWWQVATIDQGRIGLDVADARAAGADLVVVGLHWGREYKHAPDPSQVDLARRIVAWGADVVWGHHPHVLQPVEVVHVDDAPRGPRDAFVMYSLGNFVSNQRDPNRDGGVIVRLTAVHDPYTDRTWLTDARFTPVWVDDRVAGRSAFHVVPAVATAALCSEPYVDVEDCRDRQRFRAHAATLLPADRFLDVAEPTPWIGWWGWRVPLAWWPEP